MPEIGESSRIPEEEPRDIHVVPEQAVETTEPVGVESDPEEVGEEGDDYNVGGFSDGPLPEEEDVVMELSNKNMELMERVHQLEAENASHQYTENQYKSLAYHLLERNVELKEKCQEAEHKVLDLLKEKGDIYAYWDKAVDDRLLAFHQRDNAMDRVQDLEGEVRAKSTRIDTMNYAFKTAFGRWRSRIRHHPAKEGQSRRVLSRKRMIEIGKQEYRNAKKRGMLHSVV